MSKAEIRLAGQASRLLLPIGRPSVLIVEQTRFLRDMFTEADVQRRFMLSFVDSGKLALRRMHSQLPRLVLIDVELPETDGFDLCASLKSSPLTRHVPVLLTGRGGEDGEKRSVDSGANLYLSKPFVSSVLFSKSNECIRDSEEEFRQGLQPLRFHDLTIDLARRSVFIGRKSIDLPIYQLQILMTLTSAPGRIFTHHELAVVIGYLDSDVRSDKLRFHISSLRKRLGRAGCLIETVVGMGYRLKTQPFRARS